MKVCGQQVATIADFIFAAPFGACAALGGNPCAFVPAGCWSAEVAGILIGGLPPLVKGAKLHCVHSGVITVVVSATVDVDLDNSLLPGVVATGTDDYYLQRLEDFRRRHPFHPPPDYYEQYGDKYLRRMMALDLSPSGRRFVTRARGLLQEAIERRRHRDPAGFERLELDGGAFRDFAFESHTRAYGDAGFHDLPVGDKLKVALAVGMKDWWGGREQVLELIRDQTLDELEETGRGILEDLSSLGPTGRLPR